MIQTYPISKTITTLEALEQKFKLSPTDSDLFFQEWQQDLPELTDQEKETLEQIKRRFERHRKRSPLAEGVINQLLISPLLTLAGLYDEPFYVTTEASVEIEIEEEEEILRGRIDTLIIAQQLWVLIIESKSTIAFPVALPQIMTYMMANPNPQIPVYGLIGNGDEFMFIKMLTQGVPQYDFSNIFSLLLPRRNQLEDILQILKQIAKIMIINRTA
ncbi:MAG: type I restriction endonuclease subunit R [Microcystis viridis Mv_BB_P_19951000_S69]|uniref:Type I restriction endonuclease subunit R n=1 Tax=Microcystis viridis Mv_BB_P_19951000_S68D TaxID=2486270 RepID=A0A552IA61_MICVR|nr:MAG: type I restriction endonuclease subunit R [Microcystis viridis Mv_BB_P_19951000_S69]TRU73496.1 MAG: type I restriction endonuclease subunit R [Microcystis viridis Mv_BB_P_19951000_S68]TRU80374.1 MAG: type I restriction endonuclease subunit R [Microcystis viridis Mv_BB_P_19951000_S68D]TRU80847.1 MAG: type I restriction endonuclease subunit R [Microcystis viridis Mv_BB_P_19951000_S69D]